jgi:transglutaminase-like putative cysteine protease
VRIRITQSITHTYEQPARSALQILRLTPCDHDGQHVKHWRVDVNVDARLRSGRDTFGNVTQTLSVDGPISKVNITIAGEVETNDVNGVISGGAERFTPDIFLRDTQRTLAGDAIRSLANDVGGSEDLDIAHRLMAAMHKAVMLRDGGDDEAAEVILARGHGSSKDIAHTLTSAARHRGLSARVVTGYCLPGEDDTDSAIQNDLHVWSEIYIEGLGWIAFDASADMCATDAYIRVAMGLDYLDACPIRAANYGGLGEERSIVLKVASSGGQSQRQS